MHESNADSTGVCEATISGADAQEADLSLTVTDPDGGTGTSRVLVSVDGPPEPIIRSPSNGGWVPSTSGLVIVGTAIDYGEDPADLESTLACNVDGVLSTAAAESSGYYEATGSVATQGAHTLSWTLEDSYGETGTSSVVVGVVDCDSTSDEDGDGYSSADGDCNDNNSDHHPGARAEAGDPRGDCWGGHVVSVTDTDTSTHLGYLVDGGGDLDGDGYDDMVITDPYRDSQVGAVYLIVGHEPPVAPALDSERLPIIEGVDATGRFGASVAMLEDVDGDGLSDLLVGGRVGAGMAWLFLDVPATSGTATDADARFLGEFPGDTAGYSVSGGDIDGDGHGDLLIGAPGNDTVASKAGRAYVVYGSASGASSLDLSSADVTIDGVGSSDGLGTSVEARGDMDGDGAAEVVVGAPGNDDYAAKAGGVYVFMGGSLGGSLRAGVDENHVLRGDAGTTLGFWDLLASGGDVDGDGLDDLLLGGGTTPGVWWVPGDGYDASALVADVGVNINGTEEYDLEGVRGDALDFVPDVDGDGGDEVVVGGHMTSIERDNSGSVFLFGSQQLVETGVGNAISPVEAMRAFYGKERNSSLGLSVSGAGDMDGDGLGELAFGAENDGMAFLYFAARNVCE